MGGVWHTAKRTKQTCVGALQSKQGSCSSEGCGVPQNGIPRDTVHSPSTSSNLHLLLFIHHRLRLASTGYCSSSPPRGPVHPASTGSYSTSPPQGPVQPILHGVLFNQPSTGSLHRLLFIHPHLLDQCPVHPAATTSTTTGSCSSNPHQELFIQPP